MLEMMRVFECGRSGARVRVEVSGTGIETITSGVRGGLRCWKDMRPTFGAKPEWSYEEEIGVLEQAGWRER